MNEDVPNRETAIEIAATYAERECVGTFGDVTETEEEDAEWIVEFQTHTFSDAYTHRIRISKSVGNVLSHDRTS